MTIYTVDPIPSATPWKSPLLPPVEVMRFLDDLSNIPGVSAAYTMRGRTEQGYTITIDIQLDKPDEGNCSYAHAPNHERPDTRRIEVD